MNRFSEDIDLTVRVNENESNNSNKMRLKKSALGYEIDGLELIKDETIDKKGSITSFYSYNSLFSFNELFKSGKIQIESTSFTVSEPVATYKIEPLIFKYAIDTYGQDIVILPLSQSEIEAMIQKESKPKVAEGLRKYAVGREVYAYSSVYDNSFVCEGVSSSQSISR